MKMYFESLKTLKTLGFFSSIVDFLQLRRLDFAQFFLFCPNLFNVIFRVDKQPYHCAFLACKSRCSYFNSAMLNGVCWLTVRYSFWSSVIAR